MALGVTDTATWIWGEVASVSLIVGAFMQILPGVATCLAVVWYCILIYESRTFQRAKDIRKAAKTELVETLHGISEFRHEPPDGQ